CSSAAAAVITLAVLPGGKIADTGRSTVAARLVMWLGWEVGDWGRAEILPLDGSMTTTGPLGAFVRRDCLAPACCASHCRVETMVSRTLLPGTIDCDLPAVTGICWPPAPVSTSCLPSRPASSALNDCSMPAWPVTSPTLFMVVKPTRLEARS